MKYIYEFLEDLNSLSEEELDEEYMLEVANILGSTIAIEDVDFSIYFSRKNSNRHGIRVKVYWDRDIISDDKCGYMELHGNYLYSQYPKQKYKPKSYEVSTLRYFCKRYKVLFSAVWEGIVAETWVQDYFRGLINLGSLINHFYLAEGDKNLLKSCKGIKELEECVRKNKLFNMND